MEEIEFHNGLESILVYDADCGPCTDFRRLVSFFDIRKRMSYVGLVEADREGLLRSIPAAERFRSFHLIGPNGDVESGTEALPTLLGLLPGGTVSSRLSLNPPVAAAIVGLYSTLSRLHGTAGCKNQI